jgi:hypothetical protein
VSKTRKPSSSASTLTQPLPIIHTLFCFTSISISLTIFSLTSINQSINRFQRITHSSATAQPQLISFYFIYFLYNNNIINIIITTKILVYDDVWWWIEFEDEIIIIYTYQFGVSSHSSLLQGGEKWHLSGGGITTFTNASVLWFRWFLPSPPFYFFSSPCFPF